jgi:hypothetical protein
MYSKFTSSTATKEDRKSNIVKQITTSTTNTSKANTNTNTNTNTFIQKPKISNYSKIFPNSVKLDSPKSEKVVYYSDYGYVEVLKEDIENKSLIMIPFRTKIYSQITSSVSYGVCGKENLRKTIRIKVKTFYGNRETYVFHIGIHDLLNDIVSKVVIEENQVNENDNTQNEENENEQESLVLKWKYNNQFRLYTYFHGILKEIDPLKSVVDEYILDNQLIILLPQRKVFFNEALLGQNIFLEHNNSTAFKQGSDDIQLALTDHCFKFGRHYIEFLFETEPAERSIILGITPYRNDFSLNLVSPKGFWGFIPSDVLKIGYDEKGQLQRSEYGSECKIFDSVGILLEFNQKSVELSFYINKINMGVAFKNLPLQNYYPCVGLGFDSSRVRILNEVEFPDI